MHAPFDFVVLPTSVALAVLGWASMIAAVRSPTGRWQTCCQRAFVTCLVGVGACTMLALGRQEGSWICGAVAYAGLAVAATIDLRVAQPDSV